MNKNQKQNVALLYMASFSSIIASRLMHSNGSNLMDFTQGMLSGVGIAGLLVTIVTIGRYKKSNQ
ncbi:hypothetical protein D3C73_1384240 [compost metagenome]